MHVVFRTDASLQIGTGHVMRCLTLADALRERGCECRFVGREHPGNLFNLIRQRGHAAVALPRESESSCSESGDDPAHGWWLGTDWETDAEQTRAAVSGAPIDWLIVDHYALDSRWERQFRSVCRMLMVIDDLADRPHDCDLLLDQNLVADMARRYDNNVPTHCGLMLGTDYALLQPRYAELHPRVPPREGPVHRVLISFGGADRENMTGMAIAAFLSLERRDIALDVVINQASPHAEAIRHLAEGYPHIALHTDLPSLATLMVRADLAIGAAGVTSWERCCLGLPSVVITVADNQRPIAAELDRRGLVRWLGHKNEVSEVMLVRALKDILDAGLKAEWSESCLRLLDGRGAERVCSILMLNEQTPLRARLARMDDEALILQWANDPLVRQNAFTPGGIDPETHRAWFRKRLRDPVHCRLYVVETGDGFPVGQVRFERSCDAWEIDYALDARARGRKLGKPLLQIALQALCAGTSGVPLLGRVKDSNGTSRKIFDALGFESKRDGEMVVYRRLL